MEKNKNNAREKYAARFMKDGKGEAIYLEIEKVPKEPKYRTTTTPLIKLFCKSLGKCA
jgi:hypothetical protein